MFISDIQIILRVYLISLGLQFVSLPLVQKLFGKLPDAGYPLSRVMTTLGAALLVWETASFGIPANTNEGLAISTGLLIILNLWIILRKTKKEKGFIKDHLKIWIIEEYLFFIGFAGIAFIRGFLPNIDSLEKFMDFGFVNRYLLSPTLPAMDMWQAGKAINYYSFGHFWSSIVIRYMGVTPATGYNLMLGIIAGLSLSLAFSISYFLTGAKKGVAGFIGGLTGAISVVLAGNSHVIWYLISHKGLNGYWYAEATRFIHNTIHEFPGYSFVVADLHGHLIGLPIVLTFLVIYLHWLQSRKILDEVIMGILFGVMMMTNTWDIPIYGMVLFFTGGFLTLRSPHEFLKLFRAAGVMVICMILTALPWLFTFESISNGINLVKERSPLWQLGVLWLGGLTICLMTVLTTKKEEVDLPLKVLALSIVMLILIPEIVYAKDIYPDHPRANTMFKLTYQASVMIGLLTGSLMGRLFDKHRKIFAVKRWLFIGLAGFIFVGTMIFPAESFPNFYANFNYYRGLDGEKWMAEQLPGKYGAVIFLRNHRDEKNLVEAVGDSYTNLNAVSVFSGTPSVEGWRVHEWLWRGGYAPVSVRENEVRQVYEGGDLNLQKEIIKKYNVGWILVSEDERKNYQINEASLRKLGSVIWSGEDAYLIKIN